MKVQMRANSQPNFTSNINTEKHISSLGKRTVMLLSDIDGTWKSSKAEFNPNFEKLNNSIREIVKRCQNSGINFLWGYVTARPPERVMEALVKPPHMSITYNGGLIHIGGMSRMNLVDNDWEKRLKASGFTSDLANGILKHLTKNPEYRGLEISTVGKVVNNPAADGCPYSLAVCIKTDSIKLDKESGETSSIFDPKTYKTPNQVKKLMEELEEKLKTSGAKYDISPAYLFVGKPYVMFDIAADSANKGLAVNHVSRNIPKENLIIAGDGGNDISMMDNDGRNVIVVGPDNKLREKVLRLDKDNVILQPADMPCSEGVFNGIISAMKKITQGLKQKGVIKEEPSLDDIISRPSGSSSDDRWAEYYAYQDETAALKMLLQD